MMYTSPTIDRGDPTSDYSREPDFPEGRINMGAYGNTPEAATTNPPPVIEPEALQLKIY
jgi:hypothetical protein